MIISNRWLLGLALIFSLIIVSLITSLRIETITLFSLLAIISYVASLEYFLRRRQHVRMARIISSCSVIVLVGWLGVLWDITALTFSLPELDESLHALDRWIGFDWDYLHDWLDHQAELNLILGLAYASLLMQIGVVIVLLSKDDRESELQNFLETYALAFLATILLAILFPAHGMCPSAQAMTMDTWKSVIPAGCSFVPVYESLRSGALTEIATNHLDGLVTFPSFHTTAAILLAWSVRNVPVARWVFLVLNVLMIAATPTHGGHYLVDVIAGGALAVLSIALLSRQPKRPVFRQAALSRAIGSEQTAT